MTWHNLAVSFLGLLVNVDLLEFLSKVLVKQLKRQFLRLSLPRRPVIRFSYVCRLLSEI